MSVYLATFLVSEIFAFLYVFFGKQTTEIKVFKGNREIGIKSLFANIIFFVSAIPFIVIAGLRYNVGTDYQVYSKFQIPMLLKGADYKLEYEYFYQFVIKLGMRLGDEQTVFMITHVLLIYFFWKTLRHYSIDLRWSIFIFVFGCFFNSSLNIMRQFIAISIFLYSTKYIEEKNLKKYLISIACAFMFHKTAIIYLPLYFINKISVKKIMGPFLVVLCYVLSNPIRLVLVKVTSILGFYANYFNSQFDINDTQWDFTLVNLLLLCLAIYAEMYGSNENLINKARIFTRFKLKNISLVDNIFYNLQFIASVVSALSSVIPNSTRIIFMFSIGQIIYIPWLLNKISDKRIAILLKIIVVFLYIFFFYRVILEKNIGETLPYQFIGGF